MYNDSSGVVYENEQKKKQDINRKKKILIKRLVTVLILLIVVMYLVILLIDLNRYKNGQDPLITLSTNVKEYDDGIVTTKVSIGWVFREYNRETIKDNEIVPIWKPIRMDNVLNRTNEGNYPEIETNYEVPNNYEKKEKVDGILFFLDDNENIIDTYKCIYEEKECEISYSAKYNSIDKEYVDTKMAIIDERYVFITEYKNKNTQAQLKTTFLYDIKAKKIIAEYEDVRYSYIQNEKGYIDSSKYIVKKNNKYGIEQVIKGKVSNVEEFEHTEIRFQQDTNLYIIKDNNNSFVLDVQNKIKTNPIKEDIYKTFKVNDKIYLMVKEIDYENNYYKLYNSEGNSVIGEESISYLDTYDNFIIYVKDNIVHITDYDANSLIKEEIKLYYELNNYYNIKSLNIELTGDTIKISTPYNNERTHYVDEYYYNIDTFELIKKREKVRETK